MKTLLTFFTTITLVLFCYTSFAQIYIDADEDVGVGQLNTENARLRLVNADNSKGIYLTQSYGGVGKSWGIQNNVMAIGTGAKVGVLNTTNQTANSTSTTTGLENWTHGNGTGTTYGIQNWLTETGTGLKYGYYGFFSQNASSTNDLYGSLSITRNYGSGRTYGHYISNYNYGSGAKEGLYEFVVQSATTSSYARAIYADIFNFGSGTSIGIESIIEGNGVGVKYGFKGLVTENANSLGSTFGIRNDSYLYGVRTGYGIYNQVYENAGSNGVKYGIFNYVQDLSTSNSNKYGIYNVLEKSGGGVNYALWSEVKNGGDYAGYFSGNVVVTGTMMDGVSDARLKENTQQLKGALSLVKQLEPMTYQFKKDMGIHLPEGQQYGLIAQELETVVPNLVNEFKAPGKPIYETVVHEHDVVVPADYSEDSIGKANTLNQNKSPELRTQKMESIATQEIVGYEADQSFKTINYRGLIPILVGAIKEQQTQIEALQAQVEQLQKQNRPSRGN